MRFNAAYILIFLHPFDVDLHNDQADEIRKRTEERRYQKMAYAARRKEQELQRKAEQEVIERFNKKSYMNGATIDWNVVEI